MQNFHRGEDEFAVCRSHGWLSVDTRSFFCGSQGLQGLPSKRFRRTTDSKHDRPTAPNVLGRNFEAERPKSTTTHAGVRHEQLIPLAPLWVQTILDLEEPTA